MLYKRSSFIDFLSKKRDCEIIPLKGKNVLRIKNGSASAIIWLDTKDRIDYEEIWIVCNKLYIVGLPSENDLERIE